MTEEKDQITDTMLPVSVSEVKRRNDEYNQLVKELLKEGTDYDTLPGTKKPTLLKPGAEKMNRLEALRPMFELLNKEENWDKPFFQYTYRCTLIKKDPRDGEDRPVAQCEGSCNSMESKYRWRWVFGSDVLEGVDKETLIKQKRKSKAGKDYILYRLPNEDIFSQVNTLQKMAQKRAYVGATLLATATSDRFTQDMEDLTHMESTPVEEQEETEATEQKSSLKTPGKKLSELQRDCLVKILEKLEPYTTEQYRETIFQRLDTLTMGEASELIQSLQQKLAQGKKK